MTATLTVDSAGAVPVARIAGEVDISNADMIATQLLTTVPNTATGMVIDLSETTYLDSKGIHMILRLAGGLASHSQHLALAVPEHSQVRRVLLITHLDEEVPLYGSTGEAVAHVSSGDAARSRLDETH